MSAEKKRCTCTGGWHGVVVEPEHPNVRIPCSDFPACQLVGSSHPQARSGASGANHPASAPATAAQEEKRR